jgi:hypothetical protein
MVSYMNKGVKSMFNPDQQLIFRIIASHWRGERPEVVISQFSKSEANRVLQIIQAMEVNLPDFYDLIGIAPPEDSMWDEIKPKLIRRIKNVSISKPRRYAGL